jgi:hypothetical protein
VKGQLNASATPPLGASPWGVVELRRYALRPGQRDTLIELFDREFVETQEAVGIGVLGQFRDLDDCDSFVWIRGFRDMETRRQALASFYGGPVWKQHAHAANATMVDSDNVLLLQPLSALELDPGGRAEPGSTADPAGLLALTIWPLKTATAAEIPELFRQAFEPALRDAGITVLATYTSEHSANTFPALPVRESEDVFVWMALFTDEADHALHVRELSRSPVWRDAVQALAAHLTAPEEVLRLHPTARSILHA